MGEPAQKRLIRKLDLERFLSKVKPNPSPNVSLEQYTISESAAATMLYLAAYHCGDIEGKKVLDLGCGSGRLALGAAFLGAKSVTAIDLDKKAIRMAIENSINVGLKGKISWITGDIDAIRGQFDTVIQNPPFGVQKRGADRKFLEKALQVANAVYSLHNHIETDRRLAAKLATGQLVKINASPFIQRFVDQHGGRVKAVYALPLVIPHMFKFHTKGRQQIIIDLYLIKKEKRMKPT